jgi:hypothetical protein
MQMVTVRCTDGALGYRGDNYSSEDSRLRIYGSSVVYIFVFAGGERINIVA